MGILNPTGYKREVLKQKSFNAACVREDYLWTPSTIRNILKNDIYIGNMTQGKRRKKSYKINKIENVPKNEWIIVEDMHEPIIDKKTFELAQEISRRDTRVLTDKKELSIWAGLLKCSDCGHAMNRKSSTNKQGRIYRYYICNTYRIMSSTKCTVHKIKVEELENAVLRAINLHIELIIDSKKIIDKLKKMSKTNIDTRNFEKLIEEKKKECERISNIKRNLYEDWKTSDISKEEYIDYKKKYEKKLLLLQKNIGELNEEKSKVIKQTEIKNKWMQKFGQYKQIEILTREVIVKLIDVIYICENGDITIKFRFEDEFAKRKVLSKVSKEVL